MKEVKEAVDSKTEEPLDMMALFGFADFTTSKDKDHSSSAVEAVYKDFG